MEKNNNLSAKYGNSRLKLLNYYADMIDFYHPLWLFYR
jgi:hypothetical protein